MGWNYGDISDAIGEVIPGDNPALIHDGKVTTWRDFIFRTNNLASQLLERGLKTNDKVAFYLRNVPEYSELQVACFKSRLVHVNINYRYVADELHYIVDNSDSKAVFYSTEFADRVEVIKPNLPNVEHWIEVQDGAQGLEGATQYEDLVSKGDGKPLGIERSPDDEVFLYTGGTTGMPKGVIWRQTSIWGDEGGATAANDYTPPKDLAEHVANIKAAGGGAKILVACPLMHGTGMLTAMAGMAGGGCVVTQSMLKFDAAELWTCVERDGVNAISIVGDAFAKPMLNAMEENPGRWNFSSLMGITSSGLMWSPDVKKGLLKHHPGMILMDKFGSSEGLGFGGVETRAGEEVSSARFEIGPTCKVFTEDFKEVTPGSDEVGFIAMRGHLPVGYYKDPEKTEKTFPTINGERYSIPGDWCQVRADGSLILLGRGSVCINSGGEKIYPEEIEEVLKSNPGVEDALVVGVPDDKWGQSVTALVQPSPGHTLDEKEMIAFVKTKLAAYKAPKKVLFNDTIFRAPNGKSDYKRVTNYAKEKLGIA